MLPLGGLGEIGLNCLVLEWEDNLVLLDCGIQFPDASHPGVELFVPDLSYVMDRIDHLKGVVVTHGHDDHIGAIPYLARRTAVDVYCTKFPRGLITHKLAEHEHAKKVNFIEIEPGKPFQVGPFGFTPVAVQHSIIEALAFGIQRRLVSSCILEISNTIRLHSKVKPLV
ncbi:MAG: ribonuclease J [Bdellovibrionota bacterium]